MDYGSPNKNFLSYTTRQKRTGCVTLSMCQYLDRPSHSARLSQRATLPLPTPPTTPLQRSEFPLLREIVVEEAEDTTLEDTTSSSSDSVGETTSCVRRSTMPTWFRDFVIGLAAYIHWTCPCHRCGQADGWHSWGVYCYECVRWPHYFSWVQWSSTVSGIDPY